HGNSRKDFKKQLQVGDDIARQLEGGEDAILGVMIESHLVEGRQDLSGSTAPTFGQSITDACLGWDDTADLLHRLYTAAQSRTA
ncbi:MAG: 3-deoxy-7-phosphoheptulonate synthase, partial [Fibrobacterota bacterium]